MALDNNYTGITKLRDWWGKVKANFTYLDNRISTIITTPVSGVSAEEIIDARKGELALGDKIDSMDAIIFAHLADIASEESLGHVKVSSENIGENGLLKFPNIYKNIKDFGAIGDGVADDIIAINAAINAVITAGGGSVYFPYGTYKTTLPIVVNGHNIFLIGDNAIITYTGNGIALDYQTVGAENFVLNTKLEGISIICSTADAMGIKWRCSHSNIFDVDIVLQKSNQIGIEVVGDVNGHGCYYNTFKQLDVQGRRGIDGTVTNQIGIKFSYDASTPSRCPNANTFIGGRVGQVDTAYIINGGGNTFLNPIAEGIIGNVFDINNPDSVQGCLSNSIFGCYVEGSATATVFQIGTNAKGTILHPSKLTSIGTIITDAGSNTQIMYPATQYQIPLQPNPNVPLILYKTENVVIGVCYITPIGNYAYGEGSIMLRMGGGTGATLYVKETGGATNTGWVAK